MAEFKDRIRELRRARNLKQSELAEQLGVSMYTVSVWERGQRKPEYSTMEQICSFFGVTLAYLIGEQDNPDSPEEVSDEDAAYWESIDEAESLEHIFVLMSKLSDSAKRIIKAAIIQSYREDKVKNALTDGFEVLVKPKNTVDVSEQTDNTE